MKALKEFLEGFIFPATLGVNSLLIYMLTYYATSDVILPYSIISIIIILSIIMSVRMFTSQRLFIYAPIFSLFLIIALFLFKLLF